MKIAIIGSGNVGGALAKGFIRAGHEVTFGVRNTNEFKGQGIEGASVQPIPDAAKQAEVIIIAAVPQAVKDIAGALGDVSDKVIIDAMNSVRIKPDPFSNTTQALSQLTNCKHIVKCFNTTGFENMENPRYGDAALDMFIAGDSQRANEIATKLARDLGFGEVYSFGGSDKYDLMEQFAFSWINLAIIQKYGRGIGFKVIKR